MPAVIRKALEKGPNTMGDDVARDVLRQIANVARNARLLREKPEDFTRSTSRLMRNTLLTPAEAAVALSCITVLRESAFLTGRWDAVERLVAWIPVEYLGPQSVFLRTMHHSHTDAIDALARLPDVAARMHVVPAIFATRYENALFMSATDLARLLSLVAAPRESVHAYLDLLPLHVTSMQTVRERSALNAAHASFRAERARAASAFRDVEVVLAAQCPAMLDEISTRERLLVAAAVVCAPDSARQHWNWFLQRNTPSLIALDAALRAAWTADALRETWAEATALWTSSGAPPPLALFARHLARLRAHDECERIMHEANLGLHHWFARRGKTIDYFKAERDYTYARRPLDDQSPAYLKSLAQQNVLYLRMKRLVRNSIDRDGIDFMLSPFSPIIRKIEEERLLRPVSNIVPPQ